MKSIDFIFIAFFVFVLTLVPLATEVNAQAWQQTNGPYGGKVNALAINASRDIFAGTNPGSLFRSNDNGDSWIQINDGLTNIKVHALAINANGDIFAGTYLGGVFRSSDNGDSWTQINNGLTSTVVNSFVFNSSGDIFAGTKFGGVFRSSDNGDSWTQINDGLIVIDIRALVIAASGDIFAGWSTEEDQGMITWISKNQDTCKALLNNLPIAESVPYDR